jgi:hypothetical protein
MRVLTGTRVAAAAGIPQSPLEAAVARLVENVTDRPAVALVPIGRRQARPVAENAMGLAWKASLSFRSGSAVLAPVVAIDCRPQAGEAGQPVASDELLRVLVSAIGVPADSIAVVERASDLKAAGHNDVVYVLIRERADLTSPRSAVALGRQAVRKLLPAVGRGSAPRPGRHRDRGRTEAARRTRHGARRSGASKSRGSAEK